MILYIANHSLYCLPDSEFPGKLPLNLLATLAKPGEISGVTTPECDRVRSA